MVLFYRRQKLRSDQPLPKIPAEKTKVTINIAIWTAILMRIGIWKNTAGTVRTGLPMEAILKEKGISG